MARICTNCTGALPSLHPQWMSYLCELNERQPLSAASLLCTRPRTIVWRYAVQRYVSEFLTGTNKANFMPFNKFRFENICHFFFFSISVFVELRRLWVWVFAVFVILDRNFSPVQSVEINNAIHTWNKHDKTINYRDSATVTKHLQIPTMIPKWPPKISRAAKNYSN